ncbi:hypothetical protein DFH28DRAFT_977937 [Melampsora americana]|nr:hypothetical protein DFH28DRAFT_977937 [Melampsora americana]
MTDYSQSTPSVLLEVDLPDHSLKAYLLDPFIPLLRGYPPDFRFSVTRPPTDPYIVSKSTPQSGSSQNSPHARTSSAGASKKLCKPYTRPSGPSEAFPLIGFVGKAQRQAKTTIQQAEMVHHAAVEPEMSAAVDAIRTRWIETASSRDHSEWWRDGDRRIATATMERAHLRFFDKIDKQTLDSFSPRWAEITRSPSSQSVSTNHTYVNKSSSSVISVSLPGDYQLYLPPKSGFSLALLEEFHRLVPKLDHVDGWDAVVIDPPWENKSASRSSKYASVELYDLFKLRLPQLLGENGGKRALVAIWVTNRPKFRRFLMTKFMPDSQIAGPYAEWYWVKLTGSPVRNGQTVLSEGGKPIFDLSSDSPRRCYEGVILGWYTPKSMASATPMENLPPKTIFMSTPLDHSRKPNLADLLRLHLPKNANFLELFARTASCLIPMDQTDQDDYHFNPCRGFWHSVGDESPKFNGSPWVEKIITT